ncbi:MAG: DUF4440 domain-containing protein, partial [Maribacter sp.]|nr:DUF4440 domain-containing protein [Maribacter sp.]
MIKIKTTIIGLFLVFITGQVALAQSPDIKQEIKELSEQKWQWMADKNADSLAVLFHDKAKFVHMGGTWGKD